MEMSTQTHRDRCAGLFQTTAVAYDSWRIPSVKAMRATRGAVRHLPNAALKMVMATLFRRGHYDPAQAH
jgi:hypothetical protein